MINDIKHLLEIENIKLTKNQVNTEYYNTYKYLVRLYDKFLFNDKFNIQEFKNEVYKLGIKSTYKFFRNYRSSIKSNIERQRLDTKLGLDTKAYLDRLFNINRFNFEKALSLSKLTKVNIDKLCRLKCNKNISIIDNDRFIKIFEENGLLSNVVIIKHSTSIEYYNIKTKTTLAFKNYASNRVFGAWNDEFEELTTKVVYIHKFNDKDRLNDIRQRMNGYQYTKILEILSDRLGSYTKPYRIDILEETCTVFNSSSGQDIEDRIDKAIDIALKSLCERDSKLREALELDELEEQIQSIEHKDRLLAIAKEKEAINRKREQMLREKEEQKRKEDGLKDTEAKQLQKQKDEARNIVKIEQARQYYNSTWGKYDAKYYKLVSGMNIDIELPEMVYTEQRISQVIVRSEIIESLNINKYSNSKKINMYEKILNITTKKIDKDYLKELIDKGEKSDVENYLKSIFTKSFIRLVDKKQLDSELDANQDVIFIYKKFGGKRFKIGKTGVTSLIHNAPEQRGTLIIYGDKIIDGGNNKQNQGCYELKICNEALRDLCMLIGKNKPNSSEINKYIEKEILYNKSQRPDALDLSDIAIQTYLINRDKKEFNELYTLDNNRKRLSVYVPCEYSAYIRVIFEHNKYKEMLKRNYTAVLNIIIYEHLMQKYNKLYYSI